MKLLAQGQHSWSPFCLLGAGLVGPASLPLWLCEQEDFGNTAWGFSTWGLPKCFMWKDEVRGGACVDESGLLSVTLLYFQGSFYAPLYISECLHRLQGYSSDKQRNMHQNQFQGMWTSEREFWSFALPPVCPEMSGRWLWASGSHLPHMDDSPFPADATHMKDQWTSNAQMLGIDPLAVWPCKGGLFLLEWNDLMGRSF